MLENNSIIEVENNLKIFMKKYKKNREIIFEEIYNYLGGMKFESKKIFIENYKLLLAKEENQCKKNNQGYF